MAGTAVVRLAVLQWLGGWYCSAVVGSVRVRVPGGMGHLAGNRCTVAQCENELYQCKKRDGHTHTLTVPLLV